MKFEEQPMVKNVIAKCNKKVSKSSMNMLGLGLHRYSGFSDSDSDNWN